MLLFARPPSDLAASDKPVYFVSRSSNTRWRPGNAGSGAISSGAESTKGLLPSQKRRLAVAAQHSPREMAKWPRLPPQSNFHSTPFSTRRETGFGASLSGSDNLNTSVDSDAKPEDGHLERTYVQFENEPTDVATESLIGDLIARLRDKVVIRDQAVEGSRLLQSSRGFSLEIITTPAEHYESRKLVRAHVKRKREEGLPFASTTRGGVAEPYGYRPQELNDKGAVALKGCRPSNLSNPIHPLLARSRFDDTPDAIYDELSPALRLASLFLTQPLCMRFWVTLGFGERVFDAEMTRKHGRPCQRISHHTPMTPENTAAMIRHLQELGHKDLIHFAFQNKLKQNLAYGCAGPIYDYRRTDPLTRVVICLHADTYVVARKLSILQYPETSQQVRFSFYFAVLIMHELVSFSAFLPAYVCSNVSILEQGSCY